LKKKMSPPQNPSTLFFFGFETPCNDFFVFKPPFVYRLPWTLFRPTLFFCRKMPVSFSLWRLAPLSWHPPSGFTCIAFTALGIWDVLLLPPYERTYCPFPSGQRLSPEPALSTLRVFSFFFFGIEYFPFPFPTPADTFSCAPLTFFPPRWTGESRSLGALRFCFLHPLIVPHS